MCVCEKLSNWWFDLFDNDPDSLIPTCPPISTAAHSIATVSNTEANFHFPRGNPATVSLYVGGTMNVYVNALIERTINGSGILVLCIVESKIPSLTAACTPCYPGVTHVNDTKVRITPRLDKDALLKPNKTITLFHHIRKCVLFIKQPQTDFPLPLPLPLPLPFPLPLRLPLPLP